MKAQSTALLWKLAIEKEVNRKWVPRQFTMAQYFSWMAFMKRFNPRGLKFSGSSFWVNPYGVAGTDCPRAGYYHPGYE